MKAIQITLIAAAAALGAFGARAQDAGSFKRSDVVAELDAARADGTLGIYNGEDSGSFYLSSHMGASVKTRAEVAEELRQARASGWLAVVHGEDSGSFALSHAAAAAAESRAAVMARAAGR